MDIDNRTEPQRDPEDDAAEHAPPAPRVERVQRKARTLADRRNARGLTPKQASALPIMASADTPKKGLDILIERGIVSERAYYADWQRDPSWIKALNDEREKYHDALARRVQAIFIRSAENAAWTLISIAAGRDAKPGQLAACLEVLDRSGAGRVAAQPQVNVFALIQQRMIEQQGDIAGTPRMAFGIPSQSSEQATPVDFDDVALDEE